MSLKRPLMPAFLKKAEQQLLLNKPGIWSTRVHLVLYYGLLFIIALTAICFLDPTDLRSYSNSGYWVGYVSIISIIALTLWLIYLLRFNLFKKYGLIRPLSMLVTFILYFISVGIIVLFTYVQPVVESARANMKYGDEEIVNDINAINTKVCQLEYRSLQMPWKFDTVIFIKNEPQPPTDYTNVSTDTEVPVRGYRRRIDTSEYGLKSANIDSIIKIKDSLHVIYTTPSYTFITAYGADDYTREKMLSPIDLYNKVLKQPQPAIDREKILKELNLLVHKYEYRDEFYDRYVDIGGEGLFDKIKRKYHLYRIDRNISNVISKKYRWSDSYLPAAVRSFYYITLALSLLIFIFRHSTSRTFFLSLLSGVLLTIFTALAMAFSHSGEQSFFIWLIVYAILFFLGSLSAWFIQKRNVISGILINLFVFLTPVIPLVIVGWHEAWKREQAIAQHKPLEIPDIDMYMYAEIGGALLLLILLATYFNRIYRRWYSLPQE